MDVSKKQDITVTIRVTDAIKAWLDRAPEAGESQAAYLRRVLAEEMQRQAPKP